jgi:hypothetical protein
VPHHIVEPTVEELRERDPVIGGRQAVIDLALIFSDLVKRLGLGSSAEDIPRSS